MEKLVSVIVLSYNNAQFIHHTIKSIVNQDYENIEIIVVDDGSTDDSVEILEKLQRKIRFNLIKKVNGGIVSSINEGIKAANGEYTILHACDDISLPHRITQQITLYNQYSDAAFISSNINLVSKEGRHIKELLKRDKPKLIKLNEALLGADISSVGCIYKTNLLKKIKLNENLIAEDPQIHLSLLSISTYAVVDYGRPVLNYQLNPKGLMNTKLEKLLVEHMQLLQEYKNNPMYKQAYERVKLNYISCMAETDKKVALMTLAKSPNLIFNGSSNKAILKLIIPNKLHFLFKNNRI